MPFALVSPNGAAICLLGAASAPSSAPNHQAPLALYPPSPRRPVPVPVQTAGRHESLPDAITRENKAAAARPVTPTGGDRPGSNGSGRLGSARPMSASRRSSYKEFQVPDVGEDLGTVSPPRLPPP